MQNKPKSSVIREVLDETFDHRREWILHEEPSVGDVIIEYPVFRFQKWVSAYCVMCCILTIVTLIFVCVFPGYCMHA